METLTWWLFQLSQITCKQCQKAPLCQLQLKYVMGIVVKRLFRHILFDWLYFLNHFCSILVCLHLSWWAWPSDTFSCQSTHLRLVIPWAAQAAAVFKPQICVSLLFARLCLCWTWCRGNSPVSSPVISWTQLTQYPGLSCPALLCTVWIVVLNLSLHCSAAGPDTNWSPTPLTMQPSQCEPANVPTKCVWKVSDFTTHRELSV